MKLKFILGAALFMIIAVVLLPNNAGAVTISPPRIDLDVNRGDVVDQTIKVRNELDVAQTYYLSAERFIAAGEGGEPEFVGQDIGLATWIQFPMESVNVPAGETVEVPFKIVVPEYARGGGQYAAVFFSTLPPETEGSGVGVASKIGTLLLVTVAGDTDESAKISTFGTTASSYDALPVDFEILVENAGNVHIQPMGTIQVKNMFGAEAGQVMVNDTGSAVLPDQTRKYEAQWVKNPNTAGANTFWGKYQNQKENYALGKYTANLTLAYGTAGKIITAQTNFWVIPWHVIIVNLIFAIIVVIILYFLIKQYNAWLIKKYGKGSSKK